MTRTATTSQSPRRETTRPAAQPVGEDRIRARAYELYEKRKDAPGDAESDWYRAEAELEGTVAEPAK